MTLPTGERRTLTDDEIIEMARAVEPHDFERIDPPAQVWNNLLAEVEVEVAAEEASARRQTRNPFSSRFGTARLLSIAAAAVLMVMVAAAIVANIPGDDTTPTEVAAAAMTDEGLPVATDATAGARFLCDDDGCFVEVDLSELPDAGADDLELWVINGDVTDMFSLGNVTAASARYELPYGVTAGDYPIVDISIEPNDGDATHSGQSVLRGVFEA